MSAVTTDVSDGRRGRTASGHTGGGLAGAFASEWTKLWTIRTPYVCLLVGLIVTAIFTFYYGSIARINDKPVQPVGNASVSSVILTQFALVVLAMTTVTSEYSTSSMRTSLLWVPVRRHVQLAKALLSALVGFVAGLVWAVLGIALAWGPFEGHASFELSKAVYQTLAMGVYSALVCVLTVGVSFALRTAAGAVAMIFFLVSALPSMLVGLGGPVLLAINEYMPQTVGGYFMLGNGKAPFPDAVSLLILLVWAVAAHVAGLFVLRRRDA
ncbi:ABC transporter permease [Streptomyces sp. NBC_01016]|uniref:ABC transporter permease n=1 Tax=Streptomyces sp. NBC_01016 TaxID=2903720 RepID=UPI00225C2720|nr:ABC transporter permease [Streptomyces sp. NBC_01016]MCX4831869.1 ABC transporter permease [Streptomyces sp. NBC_01016]